MNWRFFEDGVVRSFDGKHVAARVKTLTRFKIDGFIVRTFLPRNSRVSLSIHRTTLING